MESSGRGFNINKFFDSSFNIGKQKVELLRAFGEHDEHIAPDQCCTVPVKRFSEWLKSYAKAKTVIGSTPSDQHLEHVRDFESALDMWKTISDILRRRTLLNKIAALRVFYTAKMNNFKRVVAYMSRTRQLAADLKSMHTDVDDLEVAMAVLSGLSEKSEHLIAAMMLLPQVTPSLCTLSKAVCYKKNNE